MGDVRRMDWRRRGRYGVGSGQSLILEDAGANEVPVTLFEITANWMPLRDTDERVVTTDVEPSRGRIDWVFWINASEVPNAEAMDPVKYAVFNAERYEIEGIQFFAGAPAHWELLAIRLHGSV